MTSQPTPTAVHIALVTQDNVPMVWRATGPKVQRTPTYDAALPLEVPATQKALDPLDAVKNPWSCPSTAT